VGENILLRAGIRAEVMAVRLAQREASVSRVAKWHTRKSRF
jgi:hypothetical protein